MVAAGKLTKRVILQSFTSVSDGGGGTVDTWADTATLWAAIRPLSGTERFQAQQVSANLTSEVEIRYRTGVNAQQRFKYGSRYFYIVQPPMNEGERNERLVCICEERNV